MYFHEIADLSVLIGQKVQQNILHPIDGTSFTRALNNALAKIQGRAEQNLGAFPTIYRKG